MGFIGFRGLAFMVGFRGLGSWVLGVRGFWVWVRGC